MYYIQVIAAKVILLSDKRDEQGNKDNKRFRQIRDKFLANSKYSIISKALSILTYSKSITINHSNASSIL